MSAQNKASDQSKSAPPPLDDDQENNLELDQPRTTAANTRTTTTVWWERKRTKILLIGLAIVTVVLCIVLPVTLTRRPQPAEASSAAPSSSSPPSNNININTTNEKSSVISNGEQVLEVGIPDVLFTDVELGTIERLMESYTADFGFKVAAPQIITTVTVLKQDFALGVRRRRKKNRLLRKLFRKLFRRRQEDQNDHNRDLQTSSSTTPTSTNNMLVITFNMEYASQYGYDVEDYPNQFQNYINNNLGMVMEDMARRFLPVVNALNVTVHEQRATPPTVISTVSDQDQDEIPWSDDQDELAQGMPNTSTQSAYPSLPEEEIQTTLPTESSPAVSYFTILYLLLLSSFYLSSFLTGI